MTTSFYLKPSELSYTIAEHEREFTLQLRNRDATVEILIENKHMLDLLELTWKLATELYEIYMEGK